MKEVGDCMKKIGNQQTMKEINKSILLHLINKNGPISRIELARKTKLSPTTVSVLVEEAIQEGVVHEVGTVGKGVGRKKTMLQIHAKNGYVVGVDLSNFRCVLLDLQGDIIATHQMERWFGEEAIRKHLVVEIRQFVIAQQVDWNLVQWVGLSVPALIDHDNEIIILSEYLRVKDFALKDYLASAFHCPIHLVNDIDAASFAERYSGSAKGIRTIVYILVDYGVGAGIVIDDYIYRGVSGQAGRISEFSSYGIDPLVAHVGGLKPELFQDKTAEQCIDLFIEYAQQGIEPFARELYKIAQGISKYCGNTLQLINPEQMILCGWITRNKSFFNELIRLIQEYEGSSLTPTPIHAAAWEENGAAIGAATLGLQQIFRMKKFE
jgi:N-acetylglucosamine repressor